jgi:superfamily II DNA or RNA helicase
MITLRPYQQKADAEVVEAWRAGKKRVLLQLPTGGGKTVMFNHRAAVAANKGKRVLIIADRRELIQQAWQRLWQASGIHAGIIMSGHPAVYQLPVQIASIQTLNRRNFPPNMDIVIIDEARGSVSDSYKPIFEFYKDSYFLGVDATPIRTNGQGFDHLYDHMVNGPTIKELEALGSLVPGRPFINPLDPRLLDKIKLTAGDYNEKQLSEMMSNQQMTADLVASKLKHAPGKKTIVFAVSIKHSKLIIEQYRAAGISAAHVDGEMPSAERDAIFKAFKSGKYEVLCNVGIACYGFDEPTIQCVQLARPTKSLALYLQQIGRGTRPLPGKENYILLDHANCIIEHGLPNTDRKWTLKGKKKEKAKPRQFKIKVGDEEKIVSGRDFPEQMEGVELQEIDEVTLRMADFDTMKQAATDRGWKPLSSVYRYLEKYPDCTAPELQYIERKLGFKSGWWKYKWEELVKTRTQVVERECEISSR